MNKEFKEKGEYKVIDAFRSYFIMIVIMGIISIILEIVLSIVAESKGIAYDDFVKTDIVGVITYLISPIYLLIFFFIYNCCIKVKPKEAISDGRKLSLLPISIAIVLAIIAIFLYTPFMNMIDYFFEGFGYMPSNDIPLQSKMTASGGYFFLGVVIYALLPAISEELIFRGIIQKSLASRFSGPVCIILSTIFFVFTHGSLQQTVYQFVMGILLAYLAYVGGSIIYSMILHFLNNLFVLLFGCFDIVGYLSYKNTVYYNVFSYIFPFIIFLLGVILTAILFWVLKYLRNKDFFREPIKKSKKKKKKLEFDEVEIKKIGFKGFFGSLDHKEKVFLGAGMLLVGILWLFNTVLGFM